MKKMRVKLTEFIKENKTVFGILSGLFLLLLGVIGYNVFVGEQWDDKGINSEIKNVEKQQAQLEDTETKVLKQVGLDLQFPNKDDVKAEIDMAFETEFGGIKNIDYQSRQVTEYIYNKYGDEYWAAYTAYLLPDSELAYGAQQSLYIKLMDLLGKQKYADIEPIYSVSSFLGRNFVNGSEMGFIEQNNEDQNFDGYVTVISNAETDKAYMNSDYYEIEVEGVKVINPQVVYHAETKQWVVALGLMPVEEMTVKDFHTTFKDITVTLQGKSFNLGDDQGGILTLNGVPYSWIEDEETYITNHTQTEGEVVYSETGEVIEEQVDKEQLAAQYNQLVNESYVSDVQLLYGMYILPDLAEPTEGPTRLTINGKDVIIPLTDYRERVGVR